MTTDQQLLTAMGERLGTAIEAVCDHLERTGYIDAARELRRRWDAATVYDIDDDGEIPF